MKPVKIEESKSIDESTNEIQQEHVSDAKSNVTFLNCLFCKISVPILLAYLYIFSSLGMTFINRILFGASYKFNFNFTLLLLQQFFSMLFLTFIAPLFPKYRKEAGDISFADFSRLKWRYICFSINFIINIMASFLGNQLVSNTAMFVTLRKVSVVFTFLYDIIIDKRPLSYLMVSSLIFICLGSFVTGIDDLTADYLGYFFVFVNNFLTMFYLKISEHFRKSTGVSSLKLVVYNNYVCVPILLLAIIVSGEWKVLSEYLIKDREPFFFYKLFILIFLNLGLCVFMIASNLLSTEKNSSLFTQLLCGVKDVITTILGYVVLHDFKATPKTLLGISLSTIGAILITIKSILQGFKKKTSKYIEKVEHK